METPSSPAPTHREMRDYLRGFPADLASSTARALDWVRRMSGRIPGEPRAAGLGDTRRAPSASFPALERRNRRSDARGSRQGDDPGRHPARRPRALAVAGVGGSAMGGDLARALLAPDVPVTLEVVRDYQLPGWVNNEALLLACSYSGDTEETLAAFDEATARGVPVWVVTSGGELGRRAQELDCPVFELPVGLPPRAALGHSLPPVVLAAALAAGLRAERYAEALASGAGKLAGWAREWDSDADNSARRIAGGLARTLPAIYASVGLYESAAVRWRAQLAENAKMLSFHHVLPEMNHNEIVGWQENPDLLARCRVVFLTGSHEEPRVARRIEITAELLRAVAAGVEIVRAPHGSAAEELLGLVHLGDWVSLYAAAEHGVPPVPVDRIRRLKERLAAAGPDETARLATGPAASAPAARDARSMDGPGP